MDVTIITVSLMAAALSGSAGTAPIGPVERAAVFKAAGFTLRSAQWRSSCDDPGTASYTPGAIDMVRDLNGDGHPEAIVVESSIYCYGNTGSGYSLVSKQADGSWKLITSGTGVLSLLPTKGTAGWPDLEIGGPGFCFPVERWDGAKYKLYRHQYEGKPCRSP